MSFASLRRVLRSARKGLCSTCSKTKHPQLEAAGAGHVGCLMYTFETLGQLVKDEHDVTAVHVAARKGQSSILIYLIENDYVEGVPRAKNGATPAHDAAGTGNLDCLQYILSRTKASAQDKDANQATPLHWAVQSGHLKVVKWLVANANASIDSAANNGITPLHLAAAKNHLEILRWLTAIAYRNHAKPRRVINSKDKNGATPLYHASHAGHLKIIQWLAEKGGGDPTIFNTQGHAPLHAATIAGHLDCVTYLFRFGSATAPGGLRSNDGASALHHAAADGHVDVIRWLMEQKECTGNERDYYQCTPLHDAAEHGHLKAIQALCEAGADHLLTDIEGNFPKDLAEKNHHSKCARYLASLGKSKVPKAKKSSNSKMDTSGSKLKRRQNPSKANIIDSYRNAPPHQRPVSVFDEDDDEEFDSLDGDSQWETLHDLMDESELDSLTPADSNHTVSSANRKRRDLEENMRREAEERQKRKRELMKREKEYEKEIRDRLMAEESLEDKEPSMAEWKKGKRSKKRHKSKAQNSDIRKLSQPAAPANESITERGIVEKRTWEIESRSPGNSIGKGTILTKLWPAKINPATTSNVNASHSWESKSTSLLDSLHVVDEAEDSLLSPPSLPTIEFLLGKRPAYLRGKKIIPHQDGVHNEDDEHLSDIDSDHSSVSSSKSDKTSQQKKKLKKKRRKGSKDDDDAFDRQYNQLTVPQSSSHRDRKARARKLTPIPAKSPYEGPRRGIASAFDEVSRELEMASPHLSNSSLNSLSKSPQQVSPPQALKMKPLEIGRFQAKQTAPLSPPQKQHTAQPMGRQAGSPPKRAAPIFLMGSSRKPLQKQQPEISGSQQINSRPVAVKPSPSRPTIKQMRHPSSATSGSGVQAGLLNSSESDSESSEYSSTSDDSTSSSESSDSSDEESGFVQAQVPKRPMMARNIGMGSPRRAAGDMTRTRMITRYPRLLNKKPIRLVTVEEVPEEIVHEAETYEDKAVLFQRLITKRKFIREWRKYMQIMKTIYRKAEKMAQRKRRGKFHNHFSLCQHVPHYRPFGQNILCLDPCSQYWSCNEERH
ncbi:Espin [Geodia barretti]|uniref:Espin n=1 Tax=Geodia barretti TaxID=519541 RepID=A0AA35SV42_GEOBA|nr:Espin [Geodia barretti]